MDKIKAIQICQSDIEDAKAILEEGNYLDFQKHTLEHLIKRRLILIEKIKSGEITF